MIKPYRNYIELPNYIDGTEDGWEIVRDISKLEMQYVKGLVKKYCGKSFMGKTFKFAYKDTPEGRFWIKFKWE